MRPQGLLQMLEWEIACAAVIVNDHAVEHEWAGLKLHLGSKPGYMDALHTMELKGCSMRPIEPQHRHPAVAAAAAVYPACCCCCCCYVHSGHGVSTGCSKVCGCAKPLLWWCVSALQEEQAHGQGPPHSVQPTGPSLLAYLPGRQMVPYLGADPVGCR